MTWKRTGTTIRDGVSRCRLSAKSTGIDGAVASSRPTDGRRRHEAASPRAPIGPAVSRVGLIDLDVPPELLASEVAGLRVFAGYSGWGVGQLRSEIKDGAWYVLPAESGDAFMEDPKRLWQDVLRRQGGDLAFVATFPDDPSLN